MYLIMLKTKLHLYIFRAINKEKCKYVHKKVGRYFNFYPTSMKHIVFDEKTGLCYVVENGAAVKVTWEHRFYVLPESKTSENESEDKIA